MRKKYTSSELLTAAFIAMGAVRAVDDLTHESSYDIYARLDGELGLINEVISYADIVEHAYKQFSEEERSNYGAWDYEVSTVFGFACVAQLLAVKNATKVDPWIALQRTLNVPFERIENIRLKFFSRK